MVDKKRKSKRLSTRKKNKIVKKIRKQEKDRRREARMKRKSKAKIPKHILMTDEDVQKMNDIKNNERNRKDIVIDLEDPFEKFIKNNDFFILVLDPRDTFSLPDFTIFQSKPFCIVLNYKNDIPLNFLFKLYENAKKSYNTFIVAKDIATESLKSIHNDFISFVNDFSGSIGILGEHHVGKNFVKTFIPESNIFTIESKQSLSSLLRKCLPMRKVLYKDLLKSFVETQDFKEKLSLYFAIPLYDTFNDFVELVAEKKMIRKNKEFSVSKILLDEFYEKRILFFYDINNILQISFNK